MIRRSLQSQSLGLIGWLAVTVTAGGVGAIASARAAAFYGALSQPTWAPPAWLFGPVWSALYLSMGIAAWLIWRERGLRGARIALLLYVIQLVANGLWTWLFFVFHFGAVSVAEITVLWLLIMATIVSFWPIHRVAALLLLPYLVWVSFASALTMAIWQLNPRVFG